MRKRHIGLFILISLLYFAVWMKSALPYRLFPSDDDYFRSFVDEPGISGPVLITIRSHHPVLLISLKLTKMIWSLFSRDLSSALLLHSVISNSSILFLVCLIIFTLTENIFMAVTAGLLYGISSWPAVYYFFYSYAPFSALCLLCSLYCILKAYRNPDLSARQISRAGIFSGLAFWSSPSAGVMLLVYFLILCYLFRPKLSAAIRIYAKSLFLAILPFSFLSFLALKDHIWENCRQYAGADVQVFKTPFFSFFHILGEHSGLFLVGFLFLLISYLVSVILKRGLPACQPQEKAVRALTLGIFAHSFLIDILPSTKLARTNFVLYPLFIIVMAGLFWFLFVKLSRKFRYAFLALAIALSLPIVYANLKLCRQLVQAKQAVPAYLAAQPKDLPLYILEEDSHSDAIISWLEGFSIQKIKKGELGRTVADNKRGMLIVGPSGEGSGRSILANCCMDDFLIDDIRPRLEKMNRLTLPYYAYFPFFLLEEEVCEGLYFSGRRVDYNSESKQITLFNW